MDYIERGKVLALVDKGYLVSNSNPRSIKAFINSIQSVDVIPVSHRFDEESWDCSTISGCVNKAIVESGFTKAYVARAIGISSQYLNQLLHGHRPFRVEHVIRICDVIGCDPNKLLGWSRKVEVRVGMFGGEGDG